MTLTAVCLLKPYNRRFYSKISEIYVSKPLNSNLSIQGWIKNTRKMKNKTFIDVNDGSTYKNLQVVIPQKILPEQIGTGSSVQVTGKLVEVVAGQLEIQPSTVNLIGLGSVDEGYPIVPRVKYSQDELREHLHFRPRTKTFSSALRIRSKASHSVHDFFRREQFTCIHTPVLTANDCEGAGEIFQVLPISETLIKEMRKEDKNEKEAFFDKNAFLTVSGQLHLEIAARALQDVYQFGPVFRAENSKSRLHLSEFYMVEAEVAFLNGLEEVLKLIEKFVKSVTKDILETHEEEVLAYRKSLDVPESNILNDILNKKYCVIDFDEACSILDNNVDKLKHPLGNGRHLIREHEYFLVEYCNAPVFVVKWPEHKKPFYAKSTVPNYVDAVDLLLPEIGELCGGSVREDNYELLKAKLISNQLMDKLNWYLDLRKHGNVCTGGFGIGFERLLKVILGTSNVKDTIPFPRWPHNCNL